MKPECIQKIPRVESSFYPRDEYYLKILRAKTSENVSKKSTIIAAVLEVQLQYWIQVEEKQKILKFTNIKFEMILCNDGR